MKKIRRKIKIKKGALKWEKDLKFFRLYLFWMISAFGNTQEFDLLH